MSMTRSQIGAAMQALYDRIPVIPDCDGRCWISCGPIDMSDHERQRIRQAGFEITPVEDARVMEETYYCEALTGDKRCAVYDMRPIVCRLWGAAIGLKCPYGCRPEGGWLSDDDAIRLIIEAGRIGGHQYATPDTPARQAVMQSAYFRRAMRRLMLAGKDTDRLRVDDQIPPAFRKKG